MKSLVIGSLVVGTFALFGFGCSSSDTGEAALEEGTAMPSEDLPVGDLGSEDLKADGNWGAATTCKPIPDLPRLKNPKILVSLNGLTLHLTDPESAYDKVFPIGPGLIDEKAGSITQGESLSMDPLIRSGQGDFVITPSSSVACKIWWTDAATGEKLPVFAGLPFLSWSGNYGMHGPVDGYRAANGGSLRRGFVSHGCLRMEGADVTEVYARIRGIAKVPVHVQREVERRADGTRVDLAPQWLGAECTKDADCPYKDGFCKQNKFSNRGFCSARCTAYCTDKAGAPSSFCVADPEQTATGMCVLKEMPQNIGCRSLDHFTPKSLQRFKSTITSTVCVPGSPGWIGDHCFADTDCQAGNRCAQPDKTKAGICVQPCSGFCPDKAGWAPTFCVNEPKLGGSECVRQCTLSSNASECPSDSTCENRQRSSGGVSRNVCIPK